MADYQEQIPFFLNQFLSRPASALPKGAQWILQFSFDKNQFVPVEAIKKCAKFEPTAWQIEAALNITLEDIYQKTKGCLFAQAVQIPGESMVANPEGLQTNGFIRGFVGGGRDNFPALQVTFLETNISFVDNVIRPWVLATAHLGLIARSGSDNYRGTINVYKLGVINTETPPYVSQQYTFHGICPISVAGEEFNYSPSNSPTYRETTFTYHYYSTHSVKDNFDNEPRKSIFSTNVTLPERVNVIEPLVSPKTNAVNNRPVYLSTKETIPIGKRKGAVAPANPPEVSTTNNRPVYLSTKETIPIGKRKGVVAPGP